MVSKSLITQHRSPKGGWVVRVVGKGTDKSHYHIVHVANCPGYEGETLTRYRGGGSFKRNGATVHRYRQQARDEKRQKHGWRTNRNSYANQYDDRW